MALAMWCSHVVLGVEEMRWRHCYDRIRSYASNEGRRRTGVKNTCMLMP